MTHARMRIRAMSITAKARPRLQRDRAALRGRFMENNHDRTPNQAQVELPASHANHRDLANAPQELASNPASKGAGPSTSLLRAKPQHNNSVERTPSKLGTLPPVAASHLKRCAGRTCRPAAWINGGRCLIRRTGSAPNHVRSRRCLHSRGSMSALRKRFTIAGRIAFGLSSCTVAPIRIRKTM